MKIVLSHGYFLNEDIKEQEIMRPYPPLGILYISAYLEQNGFTNQIYDSTFSTLDKLKNYLLSEKPDVLAIYTNLMTKLNILKIIQFVKSESSLNRTKVILGGPEVRNHRDNFLKYGADVIVVGEGEETMLEIVKSIKSNELNFSSIAGISYFDQHKSVVTTPARTLLKDIDNLPLPARQKINLQNYFDVWKTKHGLSTVSISTMRGCPYTCNWCSRAVYGQSYRRRSASLVVDEIIWIQNTYQVDTFWFVDDVFTISHKWLGEFLSALKAKGVTLKYECITRADRLNLEVIKMLKESGCFRVWIGAESGSQKIIDAMDRRVSVNQVREMIQLTKKEGIESGTFIMLGYPGETEEDIKETLHHLKISNPDLYTITVAYPIKGTPLYTEVENKFIAPLPWETSTDRDIDFKRTYNRKYYDYAVRWVYNEVQFSKNTNSLKLPIYKMKALAAKSRMWWERIMNSN